MFGNGRKAKHEDRPDPEGLALLPHDDEPVRGRDEGREPVKAPASWAPIVEFDTEDVCSATCDQVDVAAPRRWLYIPAGLQQDVGDGDTEAGFVVRQGLGRLEARDDASEDRRSV